MNIVEAFIKYKGQLIILLSGMSGSGISTLAKTLSHDLNIKLISYKDFLDQKYAEENKEKIHIHGESGDKDIDIINWDNDNVIKWLDFINAINDNKSTGVIAFGPSFPIERINNVFKEDVHIHIKLSKQNLLKRRIEHEKEHDIEHNEHENDEESTKKDIEMMTLIMNKFTYPYYIKSTLPENTKINKFINANEFADYSKEEYNNKLADEAFSYLMHFISKWLETHSDSDKNNQNNQNNRNNQNDQNKNHKNNQNDQNRSSTSTSDIFDETEDYELEL